MTPESLIRQLNWGDWALGKATAVRLLKRLDQLKPKTILECGSGNSTLLLSAWARQHDAQWMSLEDKTTFYLRTAEGLHQMGLDSSGLRLVRLAEGSDDFESFLWYDFCPAGTLDFVLVDGPSGDIGRYGALPSIENALHQGSEIWVDDYARQEERRIVKVWNERFGPFDIETSDDGRGLAIMRKTSGV